MIESGERCDEHAKWRVARGGGAIALTSGDSADRSHGPPEVAQQIVATGLSADDIRESRVVMLNAWRPIMAEPLQRFPIAVCDCRSVKEGEVLGGRAGCVHSDKHKWYIFPQQTKDELLLFVGYDSAAPTFTPTIHTSWDNSDMAGTSLFPRIVLDFW